jgi:NADH dehydrogenase FAD-containing subunit
MKRIAIVGGGYAGMMLARALDDAAEVTLIEPREAFVHNVAAIRAIVEPVWLDRLILPYDRLLKHGRVLQDRAVVIEPGGLRLAGAGALEADIVVIATGSSYARPFKPEGEGVAAFRAALLDAHAKLASARSVAIVGAGAVGVELAGEVAVGMAGKRINLISGGAKLFPDFTASLGRRLEAELAALGVRLHLATTAEGLAGIDLPISGPLAIAGADAIDADLVFPALGARVDNALLKTLAGTTFDRLGRVMVDPWLRPAGESHVFALGDVAATGDLMTIVAISRQAPWLARTLKAILAGKSTQVLPAYKPWRAPPILVPLGPGRGASVLPLTKSGLTVGGFLTSAIKGKSLFVPRYRREFGLS